MFAVPMRNLAPTLQAMGMQADLNQGARPNPGRLATPALGVVRGKPPRPGAGTMVDRESKVS